MSSMEIIGDDQSEASRSQVGARLRDRSSPLDLARRAWWYRREPVYQDQAFAVRARHIAMLAKAKMLVETNRGFLADPLDSEAKAKVTGVTCPHELALEQPSADAMTAPQLDQCDAGLRSSCIDKAVGVPLLGEETVPSDADRLAVNFGDECRVTTA